MQLVESRQWLRMIVLCMERTSILTNSAPCARPPTLVRFYLPPNSQLRNHEHHTSNISSTLNHSPPHSYTQKYSANHTTYPLPSLKPTEPRDTLFHAEPFSLNGARYAGMRPLLALRDVMDGCKRDW
jgi:hypothetical protein